MKLETDLQATIIDGEIEYPVVIDLWHQKYDPPILEEWHGTYRVSGHDILKAREEREVRFEDGRHGRILVHNRSIDGDGVRCTFVGNGPLENPSVEP